MSDKKVSFLVRKLAKDLGIKDYNEKNIETIFKNLLFQNAEYRKKNNAQIRQCVSDELYEFITNPEGDGNSSNAPVSLNQSISFGASKRSRPDTDDLQLDDDAIAPSASASEASAARKAGQQQQPADGTPADGSAARGPRKVRSRKEGGDFTGDDSKQGATHGDFSAPRPELRLADMAGISSIIDQIRELILFPVKIPELYKTLGVTPPSGVLINGPTGCGKTSLALAIAGELGLPFFKAAGPELIGGTSGESEERIRSIFKAAIDNAPSVLFLDSIDVIAPKKDASQRGMDRRVVAQLYDCVDQIKNVREAAVSILEAASPPQPQTTDDSPSSVPGAEAATEANNGPKVAPVVSKPNFVVLIATTNRPDSIDAGLRGRFAQELSLPVPDAHARSSILQLITKGLNIDSDINYDTLGRLTPGFVGADLKALASEAGTRAVRRIVASGRPVGEVFGESLPLKLPQPSFNTLNEDGKATTGMRAPNSVVSWKISSAPAIKTEMEIDSPNSATDGDLFCFDGNSLTLQPRESDSNSTNNDSLLLPSGANYVCVPYAGLVVKMQDFTEAIKCIQPTAKREGFAVAPDVSWADVGALAEVREELLHNVLEPIAHPELFRSLGLEVPAGVLFFGPPGCGKTLLAKALANQSGANFISVKGPELLNMYVGESESKVRQVFARARASAPCVIFFDELDALCPKRGSGADGGSGVSERVVNQLLTELDGLEVRRDVYIIAATNRLELIDDAMLRPGRLGKLLYVPLPSSDDRASILAAVARKVTIDVGDVDFESIARDSRAEGFSGADLAALVREAGLAVLQEWRKSHTTTAGPTSMDSSNWATEPSVGVPLDLPKIGRRHFEAAFTRVHPSVSLDDRERHERVHDLIKNKGMGALEAVKVARLMMKD